MNTTDYIKEQAIELIGATAIALTETEIRNMEITDFGLSIPEFIGLQIITYVNNSRYCAKELILLPRQTCPEHRHPCLSPSNPGKQETFRCRYGTAYLYIPGKPTPNPKALTPKRLQYFTVWHEIILYPGDQYTIPPNTLHWFQAGQNGAIISEFSSTSTDESDIFTDPDVKR